MDSGLFGGNGPDSRFAIQSSSLTGKLGGSSEFIAAEERG